MKGGNRFNYLNPREMEVPRWALQQEVGSGSQGYENGETEMLSLFLTSQSNSSSMMRMACATVVLSVYGKITPNGS